MTTMDLFTLEVSCVSQLELEQPQAIIAASFDGSRMNLDISSGSIWFVLG